MYGPHIQALPFDEASYASMSSVKSSFTGRSAVRFQTLQRASAKERCRMVFHFSEDNGTTFELRMPPACAARLMASVVPLVRMQRSALNHDFNEFDSFVSIGRFTGKRMDRTCTLALCLV